METRKLLYNQLENMLETFFKKMEVEIDKATHEFIRNPKQLELNITNLQVDLTQISEKIQQIDNIFFDRLKGLLHSFETQAQKLITTYTAGPKMEDASSKITYAKDLQDLLDELRSFLDKIFSAIRQQFT